MGPPAGYVLAPQYLLELGEPLRASLFIHMIANQTVIRFRDKGQELGIQDLPKLKEVGNGRILVKEAEYQDLVQSLSDELEKEALPSEEKAPVVIPAPKKPSPPPMLKRIAADTLSDLGSLTLEENPQKIAARIKETLDAGSRLLSDVILKVPSLTARRSAIENYLAGLQTQPNLISAHCLHVGALAGLILLVLSKVTQQELADLVLAGVFHDVCLADIPTSFCTNHLGGKDLGLEAYRVFAQEAMIRNYRHHIDLALKRIDELKVPLSPTARRIIEEHHENLDGSGLFGKKKDETLLASRILRIADDLIVLVEDVKQPRSLLRAAEKLREVNADAGAVYYDPAILDPLLTLLNRD